MSLWDDINSISVIGDGQPLPASNENAGLLPRDWNRDPLGGFGYSAPFSGTLIPSNEMPSIAARKKKERSRLIDIIADCQWTPTHQGSTNWCWSHCVTMGLEIIDLVQMGSFGRLSPASLAWPIVGGNFGGYITEAIRYAAKHGVATAETWELNSFAQRTDTPASLASRHRNRVDHWWDLPPRSLDHVASCLLADQPLPVAAGFNHFRHAMLFVDVEFRSDGSRIWTLANSGYLRDRTGYTRLTGSQAIPDTALAPTLVTGE